MVEVQFAQSVAQSFLGINLKCASCHDSFIDRWKLDQAYGLAAVYATRPLEIARCDKPTGLMATAGWLFPELGKIDPQATQPERLKQLAALMTHPQNGRFQRTLANRLWHRLMGRGIVHPVDAMQTVDGDLATVLATLRYRLQPRLAATGIAIDWQVDELPTVDHLTPHMVLQIQRILLEAFTNVLRHAQARRVRVGAHQLLGPGSQRCLVLEIADDGVGLPGDGQERGGQGLANMRARAQAIGAVLEVRSRPGQGACVRLELAAAPAPATPATPAPAPEAPAAPST